MYDKLNGKKSKFSHKQLNWLCAILFHANTYELKYIVTLYDHPKFFFFPKKKKKKIKHQGYEVIHKATPGF